MTHAILMACGKRLKAGALQIRLAYILIEKLLFQYLSTANSRRCLYIHMNMLYHLAAISTTFAQTGNNLFLLRHFILPAQQCCMPQLLFSQLVCLLLCGYFAIGLFTYSISGNTIYNLQPNTNLFS